MAFKSACFSDTVHVSLDSIFGDEDDVSLAQFTPPPGDSVPLAPGEAYGVEVSFAFPKTTVGNGYLLVRTNDHNNRAEADCADNIVIHSIHIQVPNLQLKEAVAPGAVSLGGSILVSWTVVNSSDVSAMADWTDAIFLSRDSLLDQTDVLLATEWIDGLTPFVAGNRYIITRALRLPAPVVPGPCDLLFVAWSTGEQAETDTSDNHLRAVAITLTAPPIVGIHSAEIVTISEVFKESDRPNPTRQGCFSDDCILGDLVVGKLVKLDLTASFDALLQLIDADGQELIGGENHSGQETDSRLIFASEAGINYMVRVTSYDKDKTGSYTVGITNRFPDLVVSSATVPSWGVVGSPVNVSWTVSNNSASEAVPIDWSDANTFPAIPSWINWMGYLKWTRQTTSWQFRLLLPLPIWLSLPLRHPALCLWGKRSHFHRRLKI